MKKSSKLHAHTHTHTHPISSHEDMEGQRATGNQRAEIGHVLLFSPLLIHFTSQRFASKYHAGYPSSVSPASSLFSPFPPSYPKDLLYHHGHTYIPSFLLTTTHLLFVHTTHLRSTRLVSAQTNPLSFTSYHAWLTPPARRWRRAALSRPRLCHLPLRPPREAHPPLHRVVRPRQRR